MLEELLGCQNNRKFIATESVFKHLVIDGPEEREGFVISAEEVL